ncbi:cytochrome c oxidase subunit II [Sphingomonas sp. BGYR3]|uniref:cytochrome c oxidase subunit II n=1 Tax=Sphingomonas sp. BGYR3 TaxID=2975483 RepID=UPI0021A8A9CC|nr:cytochrome c oxidase subunit II [Sphingomonas sp. BGYR3]MDG5488943.1 cytochrome c oxidase subunit II [Sphingomonas sp. BGYR3]
MLAALLALAGPGMALAQQAAPVDGAVVPAAAAPTAAAPAADAAATPAKPADPTLNPDGSFKRAPTPGVGQPIANAIGLQDQVSPNGRDGLWLHNVMLMPIITIISVFVLGLLIWVIFRYRRAANPVPSKNSHNTLIEVVWTVAPALILLAIAFPSIRLLANQYKPAPANAVTLKAIGNQWYWSYEYPDHGGVSLTANMLKEQSEVGKGDRFRTDRDGPRLLATDTRVVLPVNTPIRLITTANDVIHSWALPAAWIKLDAIPGRLNETTFTIEKEGVYFGQCSELCGARHGYMPIAVEVVSQAEFAQWVAAKGGTMPSAATAAASAAATMTPEAATVNAADAAAVTNDSAADWAAGNQGN